MGKPGKSRVKFKRVPRSGEVGSSSSAAAASALREAIRSKSADNEEEQQPAINLVTCAAWVPRGVAKPVPEKVELTKEELKRVILDTRRNLRHLEEDEAEDVRPVQSGESNRDAEDDIEAKYGFDDYDDESDDLGLGDLVQFGDNADDPLLKDDDGEESEEEKEDFKIKESDNLIVVGHFEDHSSVLEVYVYNSEEESLYVHHDIILPAWPLALEWIDSGKAGGKANYVAVSSMEPVIQVWDLDVVDCLEPCVKLGERVRKKKGAGAAPLGHSDAVLDLSWNHLNKQTLASGSVDRTTILWDFQRSKASKILKNFEEKVQSVIWHPTEVNWLLTGCGDGRTRLFDSREESKAQNAWKCGSSVEKVEWDPSDTNCLIAGMESGHVKCYDVRQKQKVWGIHATEESLADVALSSSCPGLLVTGSGDGEIQIWDTASKQEPALVARREMGVGKLIFIRFCPDEPFVICCGGDYGVNNFAVWDLRNTPGVLERFSSRVPGFRSSTVEPMEEDS